MRKLTTPDLFAGIRLLKPYGLKDSAKELAARSNNAADVWTNGFDFIWSLFDKMTEAGGEADLYTFLSGPLEKTPEELQQLPLAEMISLLKQLAVENDLGDFFKRAAAAAMK